jgi:hypothetical protein
MYSKIFLLISGLFKYFDVYPFERGFVWAEGAKGFVACGWLAVPLGQLEVFSHIFHQKGQIRSSAVSLISIVHAIVYR